MSFPSESNPSASDTILLRDRLHHAITQRFKRDTFGGCTHVSGAQDLGQTGLALPHLIQSLQRSQMPLRQIAITAWHGRESSRERRYQNECSPLVEVSFHKKT